MTAVRQSTDQTLTISLLQAVILILLPTVNYEQVYSKKLNFLISYLLLLIIQFRVRSDTPTPKSGGTGSDICQLSKKNWRMT